jgi:predicted ATPase/DNA-binding CsgD family transcriptional regulator
MTAEGFIGREQELARLSALLDEAYARRPGVVFLAGEPGVGKTRLLDEFTLRAKREDDRVFVLRGECVDLEEAVIPYGPLVWALRAFARKYGDQARKLAGPGWNDLGTLMADFADQVPEPPRTAGPATAATIYGAVQRVLRHLGDKKPVLLIFENIQWADQSTLDLVSYLSRNRDYERALLICSHRTGLEQAHPLRTRLAEPNLARATQTIPLAPFTEDELRTFLNAGRETDRDQVRLVFQLSEGNAFFAKELLLTGALDNRDGAGVPTSLRDLMLGQVAQLSERARGLLNVAAIASRRVNHQLLAAVSTLSEDELDSALQECLDHGMLVLDPANDAYVFRHALLREAVYKNVLPATRIRRHTAMAEAITANTALSLDEDASSAVELAHHWFQAGRKPEALIAALRAGAMTARLHAFPEAETHYRRALDLWTKVQDPQKVAQAPHERVLAEAADAARWAGHVANAVEFIKTAIQEIDTEARPRQAGQLHERLGSYLWEAADPQGSVLAFTEALRLLALEPPADATEVMAMSALASAHSQEGRHEEALDLATQAAELAQTVGAVAARGRALNSAGVAATMLGRFQEGVRDLRESLEIALAAEGLEAQFRAYGNLGFAFEQSGDLREAAQIALDGLDRARGLGLAFARQAGVLANNASFALLQLGEWDRAVELLDAALLDRPPVRQSAYLRLSRAEIHAARGEFDPAAQLLAQISKERPADPRFVGSLRACETELHLWRGQPKQALATIVGTLEDEAAGRNGPEEFRLCALGLRAGADLSRPGASDPALAAHLAALADRAEQCSAAGRTMPDTPALALQCQAERDRAAGRDTPAAWAAVARAWAQLQRPYPAAYARWRQADALRRENAEDEAAQVTREALEHLAALGAQPLQTALAAAAGVPVASALENLLTPRQLGVGRLVAQGKRNTEIAKVLGVTESSVARHIFNAGETLRLHGYPVRGRVQLANFLREHGLLGGEPDTIEEDGTT